MQERPNAVGMLEIFLINFEMSRISNIYMVNIRKCHNVSEDAGLTENGVAMSKGL